MHRLVYNDLRRWHFQFYHLLTCHLVAQTSWIHPLCLDSYAFGPVNVIKHLYCPNMYWNVIVSTNNIAKILWSLLLWHWCRHLLRQAVALSCLCVGTTPSLQSPWIPYELNRAVTGYRFSAFWLRSKCSICSYQLNIWYAPHWGLRY